MAVKQEENNEPVIQGVLCEAGQDNEKRFAARRKCEIPASIFFQDQTTTLSCRIIDMSAMGAGIVVGADRLGHASSQRTLPDSFWLCVRHEGAQVRCRVVWQDGDTFGIRFVTPVQPMARRPRQVAKKQQERAPARLFGFGKARG